MLKLMGREVLLVLLSGLFTQYAVPILLRKPPASGLFAVGVVMGLTFMSIYAISVLTGNKMPKRARAWLGVVALLLAFGPGLTGMAGLVAPAVLLPGLGALRTPTGERGQAALTALYAYSFPMLCVRWLLVPLVNSSPAAVTMALYTGSAYLAMRGLVRLVWPGSVEGDPAAGPLVYRPVPDHVVGLVEGAARRRARPYATAPDGARDGGVISVLCPPDEAPALAGLIAQRMGNWPFEVLVGEAFEGQVEVVVRPRA